MDSAYVQVYHCVRCMLHRITAGFKGATTYHHNNNNPLQHFRSATFLRATCCKSVVSCICNDRITYHWYALGNFLIFPQKDNLGSHLKDLFALLQKNKTSPADSSTGFFYTPSSFVQHKQPPRYTKMFLSKR
mgnify:CR=1 FL=1